MYIKFNNNDNEKKTIKKVFDLKLNYIFELKKNNRLLSNVLNIRCTMYIVHRHYHIVSNRDSLWHRERLSQSYILMIDSFELIFMNKKLFE